MDLTNNKFTLVTLSGQGDTDRFLIPTSVIEWGLSLRPGMYVLDEQRLDELVPVINLDDDEVVANAMDSFELTPGSYFNDLLLFLSTLVIHFDTEEEALAFVEEQAGSEITGRLEGQIY